MDVRPPYRLPDLSWLAREGSPLPDGFLWGVANAAYQVEGGFNAPRSPENNWARWESTGKAAPAGEAIRFWYEWPRHLDLAAGIGLTAFRMSIDWTRLQPRPGGGVDEQAISRYADIIAGSRSRGLAPVITLHHFTHPAWLGPDPWLDGTGPPAFEAFVREAVPALGRALADRGHAPPGWWITLNEPNIFIFSSYVTGGLPHSGGIGPASFRRALDQMLVAHVRARRMIHAAYEGEGWPRPMVTYNTYCMTAYSLDRALMDIGVARALRLPRTAVRAALRDWRRGFEEWTDDLRGPVAGAADRLLQRLLLPEPEEQLPGYVTALWDGDDAGHDYVAIDYYVAPVAHYVRWPFGAGLRGRDVPVLAAFWETTIQPQGLRLFLHANQGSELPMPIMVAENGMATRARDGLRQSRADRWTRPAFLRAHLAELLQAARQGVGVVGYLHWTLADNYEWGSYEPRFGLYGVDRRLGPRLLSTDADGQDAAGTYGRIVGALRSADGKAALAELTRR
jgi:beta-glucosidase